MEQNTATTVAPFKRIACVATARPDAFGRDPLGPLVRIFVCVNWDGSRLAVTSVEGPMRNGGCIGSCGQCAPRDYWQAVDGIDLQRLAEIWNRWHLNDMRAGCAHQRGATWDATKPLELVTYRLTREALKDQRSIKEESQRRLSAGESVTLTAAQRETLALPWEMVGAPDAETCGAYEVSKRETRAAGHVTPREHPGGILTKPCDVCGYRYGSAWLRDEVPADVLGWLQALPDDSASYPWKD